MFGAELGKAVKKSCPSLGSNQGTVSHDLEVNLRCDLVLVGECQGRRAG